MTFTWPTALAVNPLDDTLHVIDSDMVLQLTHNGFVRIVAGHPIHCPEKTGSNKARDVTLISPQDLTFDANGDLYFSESDLHRIHRVRKVTTDGVIHHVVGGYRGCWFCYGRIGFLLISSSSL